MGEPTIDTAVWFVEWCRSNLDQAQVLRAGMRTFGPDDWSADDRAAADQTAILHTVLNALKVLAQQAAASEDQVVFAILELPVAVVRRRLEDGRPPGVREAELIRSLAPSSSHSGDGNPHRQTHFQTTSRSPMSTSVASLEFESVDAGTRFTHAEHGVFFDRFWADGPNREKGTRGLLDALGAYLG